MSKPFNKKEYVEDHCLEWNPDNEQDDDDPICGICGEQLEVCSKCKFDFCPDCDGSEINGLCQQCYNEIEE